MDSFLLLLLKILELESGVKICVEDCHVVNISISIEDNIIVHNVLNFFLWEAKRKAFQDSFESQSRDNLDLIFIVSSEHSSKIDVEFKWLSNDVVDRSWFKNLRICVCVLYIQVLSELSYLSLIKELRAEFFILYDFGWILSMSY